MEELSRDAILSASDLVIERVEVPEWNGFVHMRGLTGEQRDEFEQLAMDRRKGDRINIRGLKIRLVAMSLCKENGDLLFAGNGDETKLAKKSAAAIERLFKEAQRMSGLSESDIQEITSDFVAGPNANSGSD